MILPDCYGFETQAEQLTYRHHGFGSSGKLVAPGVSGGTG
jgi:hypothetical protein